MFKRVEVVDAVRMDETRIVEFTRNLVAIPTENPPEVRSPRQVRQRGANAPLPRVLASNVEEITGQYPEFEMCPGLLEIRFYAVKGIPAFAFGPGILSVSHGPHEYVPI